jgi:hypothetical protein
MSNSDNPRRGAVFQRQVLGWFQKEYGSEFELEKKIPIGNPAKDHKFDIVDAASTIAIECKRYTWTETGNVPSAKMGFMEDVSKYHLMKWKNKWRNIKRVQPKKLLAAAVLIKHNLLLAAEMKQRSTKNICGSSISIWI